MNWKKRNPQTENDFLGRSSASKFNKASNRPTLNQNATI